MRLIIVFCATLLFSCIVFAASDSFLADRHVDDYGCACSDCHEENDPKDGAWVDGEKCFACHEQWEELGTLTGKLGVYNPHNSHLGEPDCTICHMGHVESSMYCTKCHHDVDSKMH